MLCHAMTYHDMLALLFSLVSWGLANAAKHPQPLISAFDLRIEPKSMRQWQQVLDSGAKVTAFEDAYQAVFGPTGSGNLTAALQQLSSLAAWLQLDGTSVTAVMQVQELRPTWIQKLVQNLLTIADAQPPLDIDAVAAAIEYASHRLSKAIGRNGYPATRRILIAALIKARSVHGQPFPEQLSSLADKAMLQAFLVHKRAAGSKGAVQFLHISKSGGTNLCRAAQANNCSTEGYDNHHNCMINEFDDMPRWVAHTAHKYAHHRLVTDEEPGADDGSVYNPWYVNYDTHRKNEMDCAARRKLLRSKGYDFYANEYTVPEGEPGVCRDTLNLMIWRHPLDRLTSHISWTQKLYHDTYRDADLAEAFKGRTSGFWERLLPAGVNNYHIRSLLGTRFFQFPIISINSSHVQQAKGQVMMHDLLLLLTNKQLNEMTLRIGLGWDNGLKDSNIRSSKAIKDEVHLPSDYDALQARNEPDVQVYEFAQDMATLDLVLWHFMSRLYDQLGVQAAHPQLKCGFVDGSAVQAMGGKRFGGLGMRGLWPAGKQQKRKRAKQRFDASW